MALVDAFNEQKVLTSAQTALLDVLCGEKTMIENVDGLCSNTVRLVHMRGTSRQSPALSRLRRMRPTLFHPSSRV